MNNNILNTKLTKTQWILIKQLCCTYDLLAMSYMQPLLKDSFLPFTNSSMRPYSIGCIINDIFINKRNTILEFGLGISTILIGRLISYYNLKSRLYSVENDKNWINYIQEILDKENLSKNIKIFHAPLQDYDKSLDNNKWYDVNSIEISKNILFDMVIIDGPAAYNPQNKTARYPAFPFVRNRLAGNYIVFLDDAEREGEQMVIKKWEKEYNINFNITNGTLAFYNQGNCFNFIIEK